MIDYRAEGPHFFVSLVWSSNAQEVYDEKITHIIGDSEDYPYWQDWVEELIQECLSPHLEEIIPPDNGVYIVSLLGTAWGDGHYLHDCYFLSDGDYSGIDWEVLRWDKFKTFGNLKKWHMNYNEIYREKTGITGIINCKN